jgi:hypothetical protein
MIYGNNTVHAEFAKVRKQIEVLEKRLVELEQACGFIRVDGALARPAPPDCLLTQYQIDLGPVENWPPEALAAIRAETTAFDEACAKRRDESLHTPIAKDDAWMKRK